MRGNGDDENESQVKNVYRIKGSTEYLTEWGQRKQGSEAGIGTEWTDFLFSEELKSVEGTAAEGVLSWFKGKKGKNFQLINFILLFMNEVGSFVDNKVGSNSVRGVKVCSSFWNYSKVWCPERKKGTTVVQEDLRVCFPEKFRASGNDTEHTLPVVEVGIMGKSYTT